MAISRKWKIALGIVGVLVVLGALLVGGLVYVAHWAGSVAQEVYGGPVPSQTMALGYKEGENRMAMFIEGGLVMVVMRTPPVGEEDLPFSEQNIKQALNRFKDGQKIEEALIGASEGQESTIKLGDHTVHTLRYTNEQGTQSEMGILNLDAGQLLFIGTWEPSIASADDIPRFLMRMPALKNDSRMASSQEPASAAAE